MREGKFTGIQYAWGSSFSSKQGRMYTTASRPCS